MEEASDLYKGFSGAFPFCIVPCRSLPGLPLPQISPFHTAGYLHVYAYTRV